MYRSRKLYSTLYNITPKAGLFTGFPTCKTTIKCTDSAEFAGEKNKSITIFIWYNVMIL